MEETIAPNKDPRVKRLALSSMRANFHFYHIKNEVLQASISPLKGVRGGNRYICAKCGAIEPIGHVEVDHIDPVISVDKSVDSYSAQELYERLFCDKDNLQVLCLTCHGTKTTAENAERAKYKKMYKDALNKQKEVHTISVRKRTTTKKKVKNES